MKLENISAPAFHRNGICGEPFKVCTFTMTEHDEPPRRMVAIRFADDEPYGNPHIAVFDLDLLAQGEIRFLHNSWRGDRFTEHLDPIFSGEVAHDN
jgi:hypothetical protein